MTASGYEKPTIKTNFSSIPTIFFFLIALLLYIFGIFSFYEYINSPQSQQFINTLSTYMPEIISVGTAILPYIIAFLFFYLVFSIVFSYLLLWIMTKIAHLVMMFVSIVGPLVMILIGVLLLGTSVFFMGIIFIGFGGLMLLILFFKFTSLKRAGKFLEFSARLALDEKALLVIPIVLGLFTLITGLFAIVSYWEINQLVVNVVAKQSPDQANNIGNVIGLVFEYFYLIIYLGLSYIFNSLVISYAGDWYRGLDPDLGSARKDLGQVLPIVFKFAFAMATVQMVLRIFTRAISGEMSSQANVTQSGRRGGGSSNSISPGLVFAIIGYIIVAIIGAIWQFLNYFTLISIIQKKQGLKDSIKDSSRTMWEGFLDVLIAETGYGPTMFIFMLIYAVIWFGTGFVIGFLVLGNNLVFAFIIGIVFIVLSTLPYNIISMPLNTSFKTFLYCYADDYRTGFDKPSRLPADLRDDFKYIQGNVTKRRMKDPSQYY